jgi:hypothetical protein
MVDGARSCTDMALFAKEGADVAAGAAAGNGLPLTTPSRRCFDLSRDSQLAQRIAVSLCIKGVYGVVYRYVECLSVGEGLMGEMTRFEIMPDDLRMAAEICA